MVRMCRYRQLPDGTYEECLFIRATDKVYWFQNNFGWFKRDDSSVKHLLDEDVPKEIIMMELLLS